MPYKQSKISRKNMFKKTLKKILPHHIFEFLRIEKKKIVQRKQLKKAYLYDMERYIKYSDTLGSDTDQKLIGRIIREYHVVEKGLTMPETRLGFGKDLIFSLIQNCIDYIQQYGETDEQLKHAIRVVLEYERFHQEQGFALDSVVQTAINNLKQKADEARYCQQKEMNIDSYFQHINASFPLFAASRSSVRNYSDKDIPTTTIIQALELARTTPSACNRQCWRTYIIENKEQINLILAVQGGNRGFGHLTNKLIVLTAELGVFTSTGERNEAFIDGGMYAMNLLYGLHYNAIAACILNCSNTIEKDLKLRELCRIKDSEVFIAMISCGIPPENFKVAASLRYEADKTNKLIIE